MPKKFYFWITVIIFIFGVFVFRVLNLSYAYHDYYEDKYQAIENRYVKGESAPRGRILDINGKVIVDNIGVNTILYHKGSYSSFSNELEIAKKLAQLTNYEYKYSENKLKDFYMRLYPEKVDSLITATEYQAYNERKITKDEITKLKLERITSDMLKELTELEKYSSYFYYLMNEGYSFANKKLLKEVSDEVYASILEENLPGIFGEVEWKRNYLYKDSLKTILGTISNTLPAEKSNLLSKGYTYQDKVGTSGLEEYYEEYLKGEKAIYQIKKDNSLELLTPAKRGSDLILEIDIDMQTKIEQIIKSQMLKAKKNANTEFYKESFAIISEPSTGAIKAIAGIRINTNGREHSFQDVSINAIKNAYTVGSAVKAASMAVGYQNKVIDIGTSMIDSCVKLYSIPKKCSITRLGRVNDLTALTHSSNYYQFIIALGVSGNKYTYNMKANVEEKDFDTYRNTFETFGLGVATGIDLPGESIGLKGNKVAPDLLMNLAIGQYDLYTPVQLLQYINTVANSGNRLKLNLMHSINKNEQIIKKNEVQVLSKVNLEEKYMKRIQDGLHDVVLHGTGYYYRRSNIDGAGKTGTSESYIDSDYNGTLDSFVVSNTFLMYAPFDNPKYSMVVISPNTSNLNGKSRYRSPVNRLITRNINDFLFANN